MPEQTSRDRDRATQHNNCVQSTKNQARSLHIRLQNKQLKKQICMTFRNIEAVDSYHKTRLANIRRRDTSKLPTKHKAVNAR